jgi:superfamily II DNA or RNA helicase
MLQLRPYQADAIAAVEKASAEGVRRMMLVLPTGGGKTVVFSELIRRRGAPALILAHRDELLKQAADKLGQVAPELAMSCGYVRAGMNDVRAPICIASVQTLARPQRLAQLPRHFRTVVVDEAHHAAADSYRRILDHVDESDLILGPTATPERADNLALNEVFQQIVYAKDLLSMIREGYLAEPRGVRVGLAGLDLSKVRKSRGDYQAKDLGEQLDDAGAAQHAVAAFQKHAEDRKAIAFVPTVELAHKVAGCFREAGIPAAAVDGKTPEDQRAQILGDLARGQLRVVANCGVLTEGFDEWWAAACGCIPRSATASSSISRASAMS